MTVIAQETLGQRARGQFGAGKHIDPASLEEATNGSCIVPATQRVIGICGDERCSADGSRLLLPAAFGGFASLVVADALTTRGWYRPGMSFEQHAAAMFKALHSRLPGAVFTLHTDTDALAAKKAPNGKQECGCAAVAMAPAVVGLLIAERELIDPRYVDDIVAHATELLRSSYFQPGTAAMLDRLVAMGLQKEVLDGVHEGAVLFKNRRRGTVLDRPRLYRSLKEKGLPPLYFFAYDEWSMHDSAESLTASPQEARYFFAGGDALNMATIHAIGAQELLIVSAE